MLEKEINFELLEFLKELKESTSDKDPNEFIEKWAGVNLGLAESCLVCGLLLKRLVEDLITQNLNRQLKTERFRAPIESIILNSPLSTIVECRNGWVSYCDDVPKEFRELVSRYLMEGRRGIA